MEREAMNTRYYENINGEMFDFRDFYFSMALTMPDNAVIAEIGVADGKSALYLAGALTELEKKFTLYMIDNMDYGGGNQLHTIIDNVVDSGIQNIKVRKWDSLYAASMFPDLHFDFVFIDSSHKYECTKNEIRAWYPKIKENGFLAGHDFLSHAGVNKAVQEVIPETVTRTDIPDRIFAPEKVLEISNTSNGNGVWWIEKKWYVKLN